MHALTSVRFLIVTIGGLSVLEAFTKHVPLNHHNFATEGAIRGGRKSASRIGSECEDYLSCVCSCLTNASHAYFKYLVVPTTTCHLRQARVTIGYISSVIRVQSTNTLCEQK
jgi:hypothetical protein